MKRNRLFTAILLACISFLPFSGWSQYVMNGSTSSLGNGCYQLTPSYGGAGVLWSQNKISLEDNFRIEGSVFLGYNGDYGYMDGADGIAFVLQPLSNAIIGGLGGGLAYQGITPSVAVEFDTYFNGEWESYWQDHIALISNGNLSHYESSNLQGPVYLYDFEDGQYHPFAIHWDAGYNNLKVWFDGVLIIDYTGNIIETIFAGDDEVFFGFTAATGGAVNQQNVCISSVEYGCTSGQGYWKTHSAYGPASYDDTWALLGEDNPFYLSAQSNYQVLWTVPNGNAYYILAHQYLATHLNMLTGASMPIGVQTAHNEAAALFSSYTPAQIAALSSNNSLRKQFLDLATTLELYNTGSTGPGACSEELKSAGITSGSQVALKIYPNPVSSVGKIEYTVIENAQVTIELYNLMGQKMAVIFNQMAIEGSNHVIEFDTQRYANGTYMMVFKNGLSIQKQKISISK